MKLLIMAFFFLFSAQTFPKTWSDTYLYVIGDMAVRKSQLETTKKYLKAMNCANPEGVLGNSFGDLWKKTDTKSEEFIPFYQLMVYADSYKISTNNQVTGLYKKSLARGNCDPSSSIDVESSYFQKFIELEIFLRSRYLTASGAQEGSRPSVKASLSSLLESLKDQIKVEVLTEN